MIPLGKQIQTSLRLTSISLSNVLYCIYDVSVVSRSTLYLNKILFTLTEKLSLCEYLTNILRTALFTVIVRYIFTSCREYPANKVGLTKK